jgi:hypothetical protein
LSSFMDPLILKKRRLRLEDLPRDRNHWGWLLHQPEDSQGNGCWWYRWGTVSHPPRVKLKN